MPLANGHALLRPLHLLTAHLQHPNHTRLVLPLGRDNHHIALLHLLIACLPTGQLAPLTRHARRHQRRPAEHEPYRAAVDAQTAEALRVHVHDAQVRDQRVVHVLPEQRDGLVIGAGIAEHVQCHAVRQFYGVELRFLGDDGVDVRREQRVGLEHFGADRARNGGFDFGFGRGGEAVRGWVSMRRWGECGV